MAHPNYSDNMDVDSASNNKFEPMSSAFGQPQMPAPGFRYMTPPHTESLHGSHLLDTNSYSFADTPHVAKTRFARDSLQTGIPTLEGPSHLQNLRTTYVASYDDENVPNSTRMRRAKSLALALLQHYYPKSDGYFIRPSNLGPVAKYGLNFMIKGKDGHDPPFKGLPYLKKGKSKLSPANQAEREKKRQYKHNSAFFLTVEWHFIEPGDITGFEILKKTTVLDGDIKKEEYLPYTYLAIMIDNLQNFPFADINDIHRGDILTDVLCYGQIIRAGHGILLFGTRLEFYDFDNGDDSRASTNPDTNSSIGVDEPCVTLCKDVEGGDLVVDMREMGLDMVDGMFKDVVAKDVEYRNEIVEARDDMADGEDARGEHVEGDMAMQDIPEGGEDMI